MDAAAPEALRVSVVGGRHRVDLVVPAALSVAELLPELARRLGLRDPLAEVRLSVIGGPDLDRGAGLAVQGVPDGAVLTLTDAPVVMEPAVDDLARAVAEAAGAVPRPDARIAGWCGPVLVGVLLALGAGAVAATATPAASGISAAAAAILLASAHLAHRRGCPRAVVDGAAWLAVAHATAAVLPWGALAAGLTEAACGGVAALLDGPRGRALWAAVLAGVVVALAATVTEVTAVPLPLVVTGTLVLVVVTGDLVPWLAATLVGLVPRPLDEEPPTSPDPGSVAAGVRRAHDVLLVCFVATGLLLAVLGPVVASSGPWGAAVALLCCAVVGLRSRRHRVGPSGLVLLLGGLVPLLTIAIAAWWRWPDWRVAVLAGVLGVGLAGLAAVVLPVPRTALAGRLAEIAETLALVALPPTLLAATGLLDLVREVVA